MRPWQHARSSARDLGDWKSDLPIHEFLDQTKASCADRRHRAVLHHTDLGSTITEIAFPDREDVPAIVSCHIVEDLGQTVTLEDWFDHCDSDNLPGPIPRRLEMGKSGIVEFVGNKLDPVCMNDVQAIVEFLFLPTSFVSSHSGKELSILMNAAGPAIVRSVFGAPHEITSEGRTIIVDKAWIAEAVIFSLYGRIMDLGEVISHWRSEPGDAGNE